MRLSLKLFLLTFTASLTACTNTTANIPNEGYRRLCESFRGASENTLLGYWGAPDKVRQGPNGKTFRYNSITKTVIPGFTTYSSQQTYHSGTINSPDFGSATYSGTSSMTVPVRNPDRVQTTFCLTSFFIDKTGHVADYRFEGPDCVAEVAP